MIIPSIDISEGKCVRLTQGDFTKKMVYTESPLSMAEKFKSAGATVLHTVNLDATKNGYLTQLDTLAEVINAFSGVVQVGGGVRTTDDVEQLFAIGAKRVVIGTRAVQSIHQIATWINQYGVDSLVLALDFNLELGIPYVAISGWQEKTRQNLWDILDQLPQIKHVLCTDISKDGMQSGPNFSFYHALTQRYPKINLQASGGVSSLEDIKKLNQLRVGGIVIGKAIYENQFLLSEAIEC